jgi:hypothetical protein
VGRFALSVVVAKVCSLLQLVHAQVPEFPDGHRQLRDWQQSANAITCIGGNRSRQCIVRFCGLHTWAMEIDMTKIGAALIAAVLLSSGPALACGQAYSTTRGYQMVHHSRADYAVKDVGNSRAANVAVVAPSKSATADEAVGPKSQTAAAECKEYSATVGYMISVPCAK